MATLECHDDIVLSEKERDDIYHMEPHQWFYYWECRYEGTSHNLAVIFATQQSPSVNGTDSAFWAGIGMGKQFQGADSDQGDYYRQLAAKAGVSTQGKHYIGQLAAYPGDPKAWISGTSDVKKVCEERGWKVSGAVNHNPGLYQEDTAPALHEHKAFKPLTLNDVKGKKKTLFKAKTGSNKH